MPRQKRRVRMSKKRLFIAATVTIGWFAALAFSPTISHFMKINLALINSWATGLDADVLSGPYGAVKTISELGVIFGLVFSLAPIVATWVWATDDTEAH